MRTDTIFILFIIFSTWLMGMLYEMMKLLPTQQQSICSVLGKSHLGAKRDFEILAFKAPLRMASRGADLNIKIGQNTQEIPQNA